MNPEVSLRIPTLGPDPVVAEQLVRVTAGNIEDPDAFLSIELHVRDRARDRGAAFGIEIGEIRRSVVSKDQDYCGDNDRNCGRCRQPQA
jgi:hypothetical protein